jgi:hypothetical protein
MDARARFGGAFADQDHSKTDANVTLRAFSDVRRLKASEVWRGHPVFRHLMFRAVVKYL